MKCPKCGKSLKQDAKGCTGCGTRFVRQSDKLARGMTISGGFAMVCGGVMLFLAVMMYIYFTWSWATLMLALGLFLTFMGSRSR